VDSQEKMENNSEEEVFDVRLLGCGFFKFHAIKIIREFSGVSIIEAKKMIDTYPSFILTDVSANTAEDIRKKLEAIGCTIEIRAGMKE